MIKGVIFDIDGIIVDSEPLHMEALIESIKKEVCDSIEVKEDELIGLTLDETIRKFGIEDSKNQGIKDATLKYYIEKLSEKLIRKDMKKLWMSLIKKNIKFGCVSTAEMKICQANVNLLGIGDKKKVPIVALESVEKSKPHPLPYLTMLNMLNLKADEVIVLEDSDIGISAAVSAGIREVYAWPHKLSTSQKYNQAKKVISDLRDVEFFNNIMN
ncbi:HAD family hydrolase [Clostridium beijerinckii]|uniref:HAD family hydrolase n=1 Tax=Clostridium beijerinckii TaxID=1520 RepID=UPI00098CAD9C|nr:HAD family phosphatase [Clostridium beijerinckii]MBA8933471.1 HAD superfamily hydrolase (TIGR01509 family) [Clostridium beijerinckii]NRU37671.1 HAD superfamily hydrolase (TIGR01509 family) [Clostridium beijerinckii]NSA99051.1 HAD superfamily hydrolase (TIGR01509 family) [Clostridium beijerinckii]OOM55934.1 phosphorylated carbohydrates phosphatase [Clostridium beijerinckii]OOM67134.1 phosphorylated carbohydrates phosphatase [Clostridium beijerinckii]